MIELTRNQIITWVQENIGPYKIRSKNELITINPLYHNDNFKLNINLSKGLIHDWRTKEFDCHIFKFIMRFKGLSYYDAIRDITKKDNLRFVIDSFQKKVESELKIEHIKLPRGSYLIEDDKFPQIQKDAINFLKSRCLTDSDIKKYNIHYTATNIVFPYYEFEELCFWQSRSVIGKVFTFPDSLIYGIGKLDFLFGLDFISHEDDVILVESIIDSISIGSGSLALGGALIAEKQRRKLKFIQPII